MQISGSFHCIRFLPLPQTGPLSSCLPELSFSYLFTQSLLIPFPPDTSPMSKSILHPLPKEIQMSPPEPSSFNFSMLVDCSLVILYFTANICLQVSTYHFFFIQVWITSHRMIFFSVPFNLVVTFMMSLVLAVK